MREIKFRAWFEDTQEMKSVAMNNLWKGNNSSWLYLSLQPMSKYRSVEVMQYTGLRDKNGVEIYEGDIIGREKDDTKSCVSHHVVEWHDTGFMGRQVCSYSSYIGLVVWTQHKDGYVVLGNIYENPELLKGGE